MRTARSHAGSPRHASPRSSRPMTRSSPSRRTWIGTQSPCRVTIRGSAGPDRTSRSAAPRPVSMTRRSRPAARARGPQWSASAPSPAAQPSRPAKGGNSGTATPWSRRTAAPVAAQAVAGRSGASQRPPTRSSTSTVGDPRSRATRRGTGTPAPAAAFRARASTSARSASTTHFATAGATVGQLHLDHAPLVVFYQGVHDPHRAADQGRQPLDQHLDGAPSGRHP